MTMTAPIDTLSRPNPPEPAKPVIKAAVPSSQDRKTQYLLPDSDLSPSQRPQAVSPAEDSEKVTDINALMQARNEEDKQDEESNIQKLDNAVQQLNDYAQSINRTLEFSMDSDSGKMVVKVMDSETDELIRQIPREEALKIAEQINERLTGDDEEKQGLLLQKLIA
jgi:flagellar protein FlaG